MDKLIINADDYGQTPACTQAILEAFRLGLITDTTMVTNSPCFAAAAAQLKAAGLADRAGIHLNLTEGEPLTDGIRGNEKFVTGGEVNKKVMRRAGMFWVLTARDKRDVRAEFRAQIPRAAAAGIAPTHADSHHHVHTRPCIAPLFAQVCRECGIEKVRIHRNAGIASPLKRLLIGRYNSWLRRQGFVTTDLFLAAPDVPGCTAPGIAELMVHPDYDAAGVLIDRVRRQCTDGRTAGVGAPLRLAAGAADGIERLTYGALARRR